MKRKRRKIMKKSLAGALVPAARAFACTLIVLTLVLTNFATAGDIETDVSGHTYTVNMAGTVYEIRFTQGPFGPGPSGKADLMTEGSVLAMYDFHTDKDLVIMDDFANFYYRDLQLIWIQEQLVMLSTTTGTAIRFMDY
jgi:hypothetical protein